MLPLTPQALQRAARRSTGLDDRHPSEIEEPLALICEDLAAFPPSHLGALLITTSVVGALASRARLQRVEGPPPTEPIVIVGWYRTGTTLLQDLLATLPGRAWVPLHRLLEPVPVPRSRLRTLVGTRAMGVLAPETRHIHPIQADGPEECWFWLATHLVVDGWALHWTLPRYKAWLATVDRRPVYRQWAAAAGLMQRELGSQLVLKDPAHLMGLDALLNACPDARLVWTHREPTAAIASHASLSAVMHRSVYGCVEPEHVGEACLDVYERFHDAGEKVWPEVPASQRYDLPYDELVTDPVDAVRQLCEALDLPFDEQALRTRVDTRRRSRPKHRYTLEQWGLSAEQVQQRLG